MDDRYESKPVWIHVELRTGNASPGGCGSGGRDFPLGLPLQARQSETIPLELTVSFANVPRLANVIRQAAAGDGLDYRLEGTVGIDAGRFGQPTFGPMTILAGDLRARF